MKVTKFITSEHLPILTGWLQERKSYVPTKEEIPMVGYITYANDIPIASAFLRMVEGGYAQIDGMASNPNAPGEIRHQALDLLIDQLLNTAKTLGISHITATTVDESILMRSKKYGFVQLPHTSIALTLLKK